MPQLINLSSNGICLRNEQSFLFADLGTKTVTIPDDEISTIIIDAAHCSIALGTLHWAFSRNIRLIAVDRMHFPPDDAGASRTIRPLIFTETNGISELLGSRIPKPTFRQNKEYPTKT